MKIGIISNWHVHSEEYAKGFLSIPYVTVKAFWNEDEASGEAWAKKLSIPYVKTLDEILSDPEIDAVMITSATMDHEKYMIAAAKAKKAIFTEKVLAADNASAKRIADAVKEAGVPFCIALRRRTEGRIRYAKQLLDSGVIGKLTHLRVRDAHNGATAGWLPDTFYDEKQTGGGAMMDLGAHPMYLVDYFLPNAVSAQSVFTEYTSHGTDDNCVTLIKGSRGEIAVAETGFVSGNSPFSLEINGESGCIYLSSMVDGIILRNADGQKTIPASEIPENLPLPYALFADAVEHGKALEFDIDSAVRLTKLMDAAYRSAKSGKVEAI